MLVIMFLISYISICFIKIVLGKIIIGGPQISYLKSNLDKFYPDADIFIRGYAEQALTRYMLSSDQLPNIKGVHYAKEPDLSQSANSDFDELPSPFLNGLINAQNFIRWETQRGCPFRCSFCQHTETRLGGEALKRRNFDDSRLVHLTKAIENVTKNSARKILKKGLHHSTQLT